MKRISIKDIAHLAGVSVATVSYVLNKKESHKISERTQKKILEITRKINYQPSNVAKSLKNNQTNILGLVVADISNDFYSSITRHIEDIAMKMGYTLIVASSDENAEKCSKIMTLFARQRVDGMIVAPVTGVEEVLRNLHKQNYPIVTIDRYLTSVNIPGVMINNTAISEQTTNLLIGKGFNNIVYVGYDTQLQHLIDRQEGFEKSIENAGMKPDKILVGIYNITEDVHAGLEKVLGNNPQNIALYFSSNKLAIAGLSFLIKRNIQVPEQVSVVAFDKTEAYNLFPTEVSYIMQPLEDMAKETMRLLDNQLRHYDPNLEKTILPACLKIGKSIK